MNNNRRLPTHEQGFISYAMVLSTGLLITLLMLFAYRSALSSQEVQKAVQLRQDYGEKEDAVLRSIIAITPNRAIRAMQNNSNSTDAIRNPLRWQNIFAEAVTMANANKALPTNVAGALGTPNLINANPGDGAFSSLELAFRAIPPDTGYVSPGINKSYGAGFPPPLTVSNSTTSSRDALFPIISREKRYGSLAQSGVGLSVTQYPNFNLLTYPQINFGYARPGQPFIAKRNWWAFSLDLSNEDNSRTLLNAPSRDYVLSLYEIPSQLAISAATFMALGNYGTGQAWENVDIQGSVFGGRVNVEGETALESLAARRGASLSDDATIGGQQFTSDPFAPGRRENFTMATTGAFFPVSLASESGRAAFVPINRGADFFDRFAHGVELDTVSSQTWNDYSVGALQCAMRLDITQVISSTNRTPTVVRFSYLTNNGTTRASFIEPLQRGIVADLPPGYTEISDENENFDFEDEIVDVAYGKGNRYFFMRGVTGVVNFNNATFGDPVVGTVKSGFWRPAAPYEVKMLPSGQLCLAVYPQRIPAFLSRINASNTSFNHSLVVNVDYPSNAMLSRPSIPCTNTDYGLILKECDDLSGFTRGFSLVTNLRLYIGDDFNVVPTTPPTGYSPTGPYYPPCSLFSPEKRYGVEMNPYAVSVSGQVGSLASENVANPIRPLDSKNSTGNDISANRIRVNLTPIRHPAELPPITMMNWLLLIEERRREYY